MHLIFSRPSWNTARKKYLISLSSSKYVNSLCTNSTHFSTSFQGALDYLEHLSVPQLRKIYHILSVLGFHDDEQGSPLQDELDMIIRKQLRHAETMSVEKMQWLK